MAPKKAPGFLGYSSSSFVLGRFSGGSGTSEFPADRLLHSTLFHPGKPPPSPHRGLRCGAAGYMLKDAAAEELALAIKAVAQDKTYLSPSVSRTVVEGYLQRAAGTECAIEQLTARQREVLQLLAEGRNTKEIAYVLGVSIKTVEAHRSQLMDRLDIHDVAGLVRYAIRSGLISAEK